MPTLTLLNGPPGAGKSTLAARYVADRPFTLDLDIDRLVQMIGGWRTSFEPVVGLARGLALTMAEAHLRGGHDVLVPQFVGRASEVRRFARVAAHSGAAFRHVVLVLDGDLARERFAARGRGSLDAWLTLVHQELPPGAGALEQAVEQLRRIAAQDAVHVDAAGTVDDTLTRLAQALG